ncbi:MAG: hypothetical protein FJ202_00115 [Gemmatimonadetes bacterium]|nr:hypothetical protein [Gemmatimonadota bacterium]
MRRTFALVLAAVAVGCRHASDLAVPAPAQPATIAVTLGAVRGDTQAVSLTLNGGSNRVLGSITASLRNDAAEWTFVACAAAQGQPLFMCHDAGTAVNLAAAWPGGAMDGPLITLTFVRRASTAQPRWTLTLRDAHDASARAVHDSLVVRPGTIP